MTTIRDQHTFGIDVYPSTLHDAYELMKNYSSTDKKKQKKQKYLFYPILHYD